MKLILFITLMSSTIFSQCDDNFTFFENVPNSINILSGDSCFYNSDINVINELINLNSLEYNSPLEVGTQTWYNGRIRIWIAGNYFSGVNAPLDTLPENFGDLDDLRSLYLEWNNIQYMPESFENLTNLISLYISNNGLTNIIENIGNLTQLYNLDLGYNRIEYIPDSFTELTNLQYLWLFNNQIETLPEDFCDLNINWSGMDPAWYPYFAIGGNNLCENVPECVANSSHFEFSLDQFYYSFLVEMPQECTEQINESNKIIKYTLGKPYPNPFNPILIIPIDISKVDNYSITIFDIKGMRIIDLIKNERFKIGQYQIYWDANQFPSGVYFIELKSSINSILEKVILEK